jgi:hypothetical protein
MTKATELAMLKLRIKFDIGILRWFSNLAKNSSLNPLLSFPKPTSHRLENQSLNMMHVNSLRKHGSYPEFGQSIHQHFDTQ